MFIKQCLMKENWSKIDSILFWSKILCVFMILYFGTSGYNITLRVSYLYFYNGIPGVIFFIFIWIACLVSMLVITFSPSISIRIFFSILFLVTTALGVTYKKISGAFIDYDNLYVLIENAGLAKGAAHEYFPDMVVPLITSLFSFGNIIPLPHVIKEMWLERKKYQFIIPAFLPLFLLLGLAILRGGYGMEQTPIQYNIPALACLIQAERFYFTNEPRRSVEYAECKASTESKHNIVLIVDESMRGDYIDINNHSLNIIPAISNYPERFINFGLCSSGANLSAESNQILRIGPNLNNFDSTFRSNPYIWQYAKKAGYHTVLIDGQSPDGVLNDRMSKTESEMLDEIVYPKVKENEIIDCEIARIINKLTTIKSVKPYFIYVIKSGMHFPYDLLVPESERLYNTKAHNYEVINRTDMIHSYINAVHYINGRFFETLMQRSAFDNTIIIYTSDHGQNLLDNGLRITHGSKENTSVFEGLVPLFVITDIPNLKGKFTQAASYNKDKLSHFNIYPTILELFGYNSEQTRSYHGKSMLEPITDKRKFLTGLLVLNRIKIGKYTANRWYVLPDTLVAQN